MAIVHESTISTNDGSSGQICAIINDVVGSTVLAVWGISYGHWTPNHAD
jgi:hypothetical protein